MKSKDFKTILEDIIPTKYVYTEEYQDKYYLFKQLKERIPHLDEDIIYKAINFANNSVEKPRKSSKFIEAFIKKILDNIY